MEGSERVGPSGSVEDRIEAHLTEHHAIFDARELRAVVLEQSAGEMPPDVALEIAREMVRDRRVLTLEGGRMTTLAIRAQEQAIERRVAELAQPAGRDAGERARQGAVREVAERIGAPPQPRAAHALKAVTGPERPPCSSAPPAPGRES